MKTLVTIILGWRIWDNGPAHHPTTGRFEAESSELMMSGGSKHSIIRMVHQHVAYKAFEKRMGGRRELNRLWHLYDNSDLSRIGLDVDQMLIVEEQFKAAARHDGFTDEQIKEYLQLQG